MKNFIIGFLIAIILFMLFGANYERELGRYQGVPWGSSVAIIDTRTGILRTSHEKGKLIKSSWVGEIYEYDFFGYGR